MAGSSYLILPQSMNPFPVLIGASDSFDSITVQNMGAQTVYYGRSDVVVGGGVGSIAAGATAVLAPGQYFASSSYATLYVTPGNIDLDVILRPTAAIAETIPARLAPSNITSILASGTMQCVALPLRSGTTVSSISVFAGTTAIGTPTNQWCALLRYSDRSVLGKTADQTNTAWAGDAKKTFTFATPVTVFETGVYAIGLVTVAGTPPTLRGISSSTAINGEEPKVGFRSTTGLTDPASLGATAAAYTDVTGGVFYAYVS